ERGIAGHERDPARVAAKVDRRPRRVRRDDSHVLEVEAEFRRYDLHLHGVRALADLRGAAKNGDRARAVNREFNRGVGHLRPDDGIGGAAHVMAPRDADAFAVGELPVFLLPGRALDDLLDALRVAVAQHAQAVDRHAGRLEQVPAAQFHRIDPQHGGHHVELLLEGKARIDGAVPAHGAAGRLVGQHAVAVKLDVWDVVHGVQQLARVKDGYDAVAAIRAAVLDDARLDRRQRAVAPDAGLKLDDRPRAAAV